MLIKRLTFVSIIGLVAACGASDHSKKEPTQDPTDVRSYGYDYVHQVPVHVLPALTATNISFGEASILGSFEFEQGTTSHQFMMPLQNKGTETLCFVQVGFQPQGETNRQYMAQESFAGGPTMLVGSIVSPCLPAGASGYLLSFIDSSVAELKGIVINDVSAAITPLATLVKQVSIVKQTLSPSRLSLTLRNETDHSLHTSSFSNWILRTPEKVFDWGFFDDSSVEFVAPGETFELSSGLYMQALPPHTTLEFVPDEFSAL